MDVVDHSVSKEQFEIWECAACTLRFTQDVPPEDQIGRYYQSLNYISHSNTKQGLVNRLYHVVRNYTLTQKRNLIKNTTGLATGTLLDIGAGAGTFAAYMKRSGWEITGLEPDGNTRANAWKEYGINLQPSEQLFDLVPQSYNVITMWHVCTIFMDTWQR
jgi:2-polyprenyl-3-methyl-5-hydroxy-6-metoxy-1,4-benzoquinol methylase